jgi:hypothetical protein
MNRLALIAAVLLVSGCAKSKSGDRCEIVVDKSMKVLGDLAKMRGARLGDPEKKELVAQCRKAVKAGKPDPQMDCVIAAKDDAGVSACYTKGYEQYLARSKEIEAKLQLGKLGKLATTAFVENAEFPKGKVGPTPATPCCGEGTKQCTPTETTWADPVWKALDFAVEGAFHFQYTYESDGKTFTATATGDVECTGKPTTTSIVGKIGDDGAPVISKP